MAERFNPDTIAYCEAEGWRAYYDKNYPRGYQLMCRLVRNQFGLSWPQTLAAALEIVRAYAAFQPKNGDLVKTRHFLEAFYRRARPHAPTPYDPKLVAQRELEYWIVHRVTVLDPNREPLIRSLQALHSALFCRPEPEMRSSAEHRALAADAVDRITNRVTADADADWAIVHQELQLAYRDVTQVLKSTPSAVR